MYILKNAWRSIVRSKGRNILIGIIIFVIAVSACISLSIGEAAKQAKESSASELEITGQISVDRQSLMEGQESQSDMKDALTNMEELSLEDLEKYAKSDYVKSFYYTASVSMNASGELEAVDTSGTADTDSASETDSTAEADAASDSGSTGETQSMDADANGGMAGEAPDGGGDMGGGMGRMGTQGDFTVTGYSSDEAMTDFLDGSASITEGSVFDENDATGQCIISSELASYNSLSVGDTITLSNPNSETETYTLTISGIYESSDSGDSFSNMMGGFGASFDSANRIYTSYENVAAITEASAEADTAADTDSSTALRSQTNGTYTFASVGDYESFKEETEESLGDNYTVSSADVSSYEQSLQPLENLSKYAGYFLAVVLVIGGVILVVLNIFSIRERKYEIGVLAAIGMKKGKIAAQFLTELLIVTFAAILIGAAAGGVSSVPITNALLAQQTASQQETAASQAESFGRETGDMQGGPGDGPGGVAPDQGSSSGSSTDSSEAADESSDSSTNSGSGSSESTDSSETAGGAPEGGKQDDGMGMPDVANYVSQVDSAMNLAVVGKLILIGIALTLVSGCVAVVFILRYDPLRILSSRD